MEMAAFSADVTCVHKQGSKSPHISITGAYEYITGSAAPTRVVRAGDGETRGERRRPPSSNAMTPLEFAEEPAAMYRPTTDHEKLIQIAAACQEAILAQREREARHGYGLDDYTEGRIVGAANLARSIMRVLSGGQPDAATLRARSRKHLNR
jgi:hypothetical protein